jgi:hypothetical protein
MHEVWTDGEGWLAVLDRWGVRSRYDASGDRLKKEFWYGVHNQCESFIYLDLIVKNREIPIERYFKCWISTKLVWIKY